MKNLGKWLLATAVGAWLVAAGGCERHGHRCTKGVNAMEEADLLAIYEREGFDEVFIVNPQGEQVAHYILIEPEGAFEGELPEGAELIATPVKRMIVDSEVYASAFEELGSDSIIGGMFDANFVTSPTLRKRIDTNRIKNVGQASSPDVEGILAMQPEAIMLSYFEGMNAKELDKTGVPIIKMFDIQEHNPLGRAEWLRFIGRLAGKGEQADSIFREVKQRYNAIKASGVEKADDAVGPMVLTETMYEGVWYVPGGRSYQAKLIGDAGGKYFKREDGSEGSLNLTAEQVLTHGGDADVWIIRYFGDKDHVKAILSADPIYSEIKAYKDKNVYISDTSRSGLFREFPFHPDLLLEDYRVIFSADSLATLRYFEKLDR